MALTHFFKLNIPLPNQQGDCDTPSQGDSPQWRVSIFEHGRVHIVQFTTGKLSQISPKDLALF